MGGVRAQLHRHNTSKNQNLFNSNSPISRAEARADIAECKQEDEEMQPVLMARPEVDSEDGLIVVAVSKAIERSISHHLD